MGSVSISARIRASLERVTRVFSGRVRRPRYTITLNWVAQFAIVAAILFFLGLNTPHGLVTLELPATRMAQIFGYADAGSYLQAAQSLVTNGRTIPDWAWVLNLWPPGMVWLDGMALHFSPLAFGVTIALVTALVWSIPLAILSWPFMKSPQSALVVFVVELAALGTSPFQSWMFDEGLFYADALAAGLFLLSMSLIVNRMRAPAPVHSWVRDGIFAGIALAAANYLRTSYSLVAWVLAATAILLGILIAIRRRKKHSTKDLLLQVIILSTAVLSVVVLMQPYTSYELATNKRVQFTTTEDLVYQHVWQNPTTDKVPQWMLEGGSTLGCDLDATECARIHVANESSHPPKPDQLRNELVKAILTHPVAFVENRVHYVSTQWFADELGSYSHVPTDYRSGPVSYASSPNPNVPQGLFYLALVIGAVACSIVLARRGLWSLLALPLVLAGLLAPFAMVHVEVRYLIPLKMIGLLTPMLILMARTTKTHSRVKNKGNAMTLVFPLPESRGGEHKSTGAD